MIIGLKIKSNGDIYWYKDDNLHREDGPAVIRADGYKGWWKNGVFIKQEHPK